MIHRRAVFLVGRVAPLTHRVLDLADRVRVDQVVLAARPVVIVPAEVEFSVAAGNGTEGELVPHARLFARQYVNVDSPMRDAVPVK